MLYEVRWLHINFEFHRLFKVFHFHLALNMYSKYIYIIEYVKH